MKNKIAIIGLGQVGTTILYNLFLTSSNLEIVLLDNHPKRSLAHIIDLNHCLNDKVKLKLGNYNDLDDCNILIVASGIKYDKNRINFLQNSYLMIKEIVENINKTKFNGHIIVVSNPNDVLTTYVAKNYQEDKVIGTGTLLDINRLKYFLSDMYQVSSNKIEASILGEHGNSQVILFDDIKIENKKINLTKKERDNLKDKVINIANNIVDMKGYTNFGVTDCVLKIINSLLNSSLDVLIISSYDKSHQIAYSYPVIIDNGKIKRIDNLKYSKKLLQESIKKTQREYKIFSNLQVIGIDLDDTITNIRDYMHEAAFQFAKEKKLKIIDNTKYLVGEKYGFNKEQLDEFFLNYRIKVIQEAKIRDDVKEVLTNLLNLGYKIVIITARSPKYYDNPYEYTKKWLDLNQIPYTKLIVDGKNKKEICEQENVSIFIDDMPSNCLEVATLKNVKVFIMDNVDNYLSDNKIKRIYSFKELYKEIE